MYIHTYVYVYVYIYTYIYIRLTWTLLQGGAGAALGAGPRKPVSGAEGPLTRVVLS